VFGRGSDPVLTIGAGCALPLRSTATVAPTYPLLAIPFAPTTENSFAGRLRGHLACGRSAPAWRVIFVVGRQARPMIPLAIAHGEPSRAICPGLRVPGASHGLEIEVIPSVFLEPGQHDLRRPRKLVALSAGDLRLTPAQATQPRLTSGHATDPI